MRVEGWLISFDELMTEEVSNDAGSLFLHLGPEYRKSDSIFCCLDAHIGQARMM